MSKVEKIVCQGINFVVRDRSNSYEDQSNGFSVHAPFILSTDEASIKSLRNDIKSEIDHGKEWDILREDKGFITSENRFVNPKEAMKVALDAEQFEYLIYNSMEIRVLERMKLATQAKISKKLRKEWIEIMSERGFLPEDLY